MAVRRAGARWLVGMATLAQVICAGCSAWEPGLSPAFQQHVENMNRKAGDALTNGLAEQVVPPGSEPPAEAERTTVRPGEPIWIQSGKSRMLHFRDRIERVSLSDPDLAGLVVLGPHTVLINARVLEKERQPDEERGFQIGRTATLLGRTLTEEPNLAETTLTVWDAQGVASSHTVIIADFTNQQVMLDVTVAEINRTAMEQHGIDIRVVQDNFIVASMFGAGIPPQVLNTVPPQIIQPLLPLTVGPDTPTYAFIFPNEDFTAFVQAMETEGLASILARPRLMALSGQNAVFQVGGEIPIRIATGFTADVEFKPFGTIVNFVPRVSDEGDIMLTVTPEVSEADFSRTVEGIPTFRVRRASTSARLRNAETLILGGLLQTRTQEEVRGVPYLKDIPYLGYIFRFTRYVQDTTELMVMVRPQLVRPIGPGRDIPLPTNRGPLTYQEERTQPEEATETRPRLPLVP